MKKLFFTLLIAICAISCSQKETTASNPLLEPFSTLYGAPDFDKIKNEHYKPAILAAIEEAKGDINAITASTQEPTFANTIEALERSGNKLTTILGIFFNITNTESTDELQAIEAEISQPLSEYSTDISLNAKLFERIKSVYDRREELQLDNEQSKLLEKTYKSFERSGALLSDTDKEKLRGINSELSKLSIQFGQNVLNSTNAFVMNVTDSSEISDLPEYVKVAAKEEAQKRSLTGWAFTLDEPSYVPFITYSSNRELKEKLWRANGTTAYRGEYDNSENVKRIANLRLEYAKLMGYTNYADYVLAERMAENSTSVLDFLNLLAEKSLPIAIEQHKDLEKFAKSQGADFKIMPWDMPYFSNKYKNSLFNIDDEQLKPYFKLENAQKGVFMLAEKLYGIHFKENSTLPKYNKDVTVYEVFDGERMLALLYLDYFPRKGKGGGAWMNSFREQSIDANNNEIRPIITVVNNFTKPTENEPSLLTFGEVTTLLHEFGHALHGIFAEGKYSSLTGTNVYRDFVELPSQIMENWATEREFLDMWAVHYKTGEKMPEELINNLISSNRFQAAYKSTRQVSLAKLDMSLHSITSPLDVDLDLEQFEKASNASTQILPAVDSVLTLTSFGHILSGGYAAGYYGYKWAELLDADAFSLFKDRGIFNKEVAQSFRANILSKGSMEHPMDLYVKFRGSKPEIDGLLNKLK